MSQKPIPIFSQGQVCEFRARSGSPVVILGAFDSSHLAFDRQVATFSSRFQAAGVHRVRLRGSDAAATMLGTFNGVHAPVTMATHDGFIELVIVVAPTVPGARAIERATMLALLRRTR